MMAWQAVFFLRVFQKVGSPSKPSSGPFLVRHPTKNHQVAPAFFWETLKSNNVDHWPRVAWRPTSFYFIARPKGFITVNPASAQNAFELLVNRAFWSNKNTGNQRILSSLIAKLIGVMWWFLFENLQSSLKTVQSWKWKGWDPLDHL